MQHSAESLSAILEGLLDGQEALLIRAAAPGPPCC
jgi:hypothetical protein